MTVEIFAPVPDPKSRNGDWMCEYRIAGLARPIDRRACGVDSIQALRLALEIIGTDLNCSEERNAESLYWFEPNDSLGFPVPAEHGRHLTERADLALVDRGLVPSRARAKAEIEAGTIYCDGKRVIKPSQPVAKGSVLEIRGVESPWVSRGGLKLDFALERFGISVAGKIALDLGASTGGFTEVLLSRGAARVYSIDVGHDQLHERLRGDSRVISREGVNARDLDESVVPEKVGIFAADVSFISLKLALPPALALAAPEAVLLALVKPQFEAGRDAAKKGVVRDPSIHERVCAEIADFVSAQPGWHVLGVIPSPINGAGGNREFLLAAQRQCA